MNPIEMSMIVKLTGRTENNSPSQLALDSSGAPFMSKPTIVFKQTCTEKNGRRKNQPLLQLKLIKCKDQCYKHLNERKRFKNANSCCADRII